VLFGRGDAFSLSEVKEAICCIYAPEGNRQRFVYKPRRESLSRWTRTNSIFNPLLGPRWRRLASPAPRGLVSVLGNAARIRRLGKANLHFDEPQLLRKHQFQCRAALNPLTTQQSVLSSPEHFFTQIKRKVCWRKEDAAGPTFKNRPFKFRG